MDRAFPKKQIHEPNTIPLEFFCPYNLIYNVQESFGKKEAYMSPNPLSIDHQARFSSLCSNLQIPLSEYNFANLYLFRAVHQYHVLALNSTTPAIVGASYDHQTFLMPIFHPQEWAAWVREAQKLKVDFIYPIPEIWFDEIRLQGYPVSFQDGDSDYLYESSSIKEYRGRHFDGQRNAIRQLLSDHEITVERLNSSTVSAASCVINDWAEEDPTPQRLYEAQVCLEAAHLVDVLQLEGWIFRVDGQPKGLLIGSPLTHDTYCFHFEKAHRSFRGLPAYMFQTVARELDPKYHYLNWEQDLGDAGLRQAKESYRPLRKELKGRLACNK
jgi:hypothetical protein